MKILQKINTLFFILLISSFLYAQDFEVNMLNSSNRGVMAFEPSVLHVSVGDTVKFVPKQVGGHNSQSMYIPSNSTAWNGGVDSEVSIVIDKPGVYFYVCQPHLPMGMVGFIVADKDLSNFPEIEEKVLDMQKSWVMNKDRVKQDLESIAK